MKKFNLKEIAEFTSIPQSTLHDLQSRKTTPSKKTVNRILEIFEKYCDILNYAVQNVELKTQKVIGRKPKPTQIKDKSVNKDSTNTNKFSNTKVTEHEQVPSIPENISKCPKCNGKVEVFQNRYRKNYFLGCPNWKSNRGGCKWTQDL